MKKDEVKRILTAPICFLQRSTEEERALFSDMGNRSFYTFRLASGQRFVGHISTNDKESYIFRPLKNLVPNLLELKWEKTEDITDLGYRTICQVKEGTSDEEKSFYEKVLSPKPVSAPFLTKANIQHYSYHPMLERCIWFRRLNKQHEETQKALLKIQRAKEALLIPEKGNDLIQQKLKERRQNG